MAETIGQRIKAMRKKMKMTQISLAEKAFISESYIALIELDKRNPSTDVIIKLAEVFNVSTDYLLFGNMEKDDIVLFNEWKTIMQGRPTEEIEAAHDVVKIFFRSIDICKDSN